MDSQRHQPTNGPRAPPLDVLV